MKIGLISGHGAGDPGALGCGYAEANLTVEVVKKLSEVLNNYGVETKIYPYENNAYYDCKNGCFNMNFSDCTYVLEVHFNACVNDQDGDGHVTGTEIWVTPREEGISVEECILSKIESLGFTNRGVKREDFYVINVVKSQGVSSALIETCFIDDRDDMNLFISREDEVVDAIARGIIEGYGGTVESYNDDNEQEYYSSNINDMRYDNTEFIEKIAREAMQLVNEFGIKVVSPIIAQACLESGYGTSEKARHFNFFGLKYREGRVDCHSGYFNDDTTEQEADGSYTPCNTDWYAFDNFHNAVKGYLQFIDIDRYSNLKGVEDPYEYLRLIKEDGYATSHEYVDNVYRTLKDNSLERFDFNYSHEESYTEPEHIDTPYNVDEMARRVIQGEYGNGEERRERLEAEGYDYSVVQSRVNKMLS